ncbi:MAG: PH domain-containing protein [Pseudomonadales bacterium]|nr:PH domain-containing protein [Pseudomonadales bacterium]
MKKHPIEGFSNSTVKLSHLPTLAEIPYQALDPEYPKLVVLQSTIIATFPLLVIGGLVALFSQQPQQKGALDFNIILYSLAFFGLLIAGFIYLSYLEAKSKRYCLRQHDLILQYGVLTKNTIAQPFHRVQHIEVSQNPLELRFGLASLKLFSAGGFRHTFAIPGLTQEQAEKIRQFVLDYQENTHEG